MGERWAKGGGRPPRGGGGGAGGEPLSNRGLAWDQIKHQKHKRRGKRAARNTDGWSRGRVLFVPGAGSVAGELVPDKALVLWYVPPPMWGYSQKQEGRFC